MAIQNIRHFLKMGEKGQGMTEYIIMVALIAIAAIGVYALFGKQVRHVVASIGSALSGDPKDTTPIDIETEAAKEKTLKDFGTTNAKWVSVEDHITMLPDSHAEGIAGWIDWRNLSLQAYMHQRLWNDWSRMRSIYTSIKQAVTHEDGQTMTEYVIVTAAVVAGVLTINAVIIPPLNDLYELIADVVSLPIP